VAKKFANLTQNILYQVKPGFAINLPLLLFVSAKLELESTYLEGSGVGVRIRSVPENSYLCVNPDGDLTLEVHGNTLDRCVFAEDLYHGHRTFRSMYNISWYIGFKRNGKVKQPHNTTKVQKAARFIPYKN